MSQPLLLQINYMWPSVEHNNWLASFTILKNKNLRLRMHLIKLWNANVNVEWRLQHFELMDGNRITHFGRGEAGSIQCFLYFLLVIFVLCKHLRNAETFNTPHLLQSVSKNICQKDCILLLSKKLYEMNIWTARDLFILLSQKFNFIN